MLAALLWSRELLACAPAPHPGQHIAVVEESAVIIWEPATKTQHFIRRATFQGEGSDFGFLVPTPAAPTLAQVDDYVFDDMQRLTTRKTVYRTEYKTDFTPLIFLPFRRTAKAPPLVTSVAPVEVLATQKVAGYEASVLNATDATALHKWLGQHGYATTPDLTEWLSAYVSQRWIITAFKIDKTQDATARTSAVKMSFTTDRPFFPYREPASQREIATGSRMLRIWFIGPERVTGVIGGGAAWPGQLYWSEEVRDLEIGDVKPPAGSRLTAFDDASAVRPGMDDLFFVTDPDQRVVVPPPHEITDYETRPIPLDVVIAPVLILGLWLRRKRRRDKRSTEPPDDSPDRRSDG